MIAKNDRTIVNAFKRLATTEYLTAMGGMKALLDSAVVFALQRHEEEGLPHHLETGDSYGWALGYQGQCVAIKVTTGENYSEDSVHDTLKAELIKHSKSVNRYVGIVMAGMDPPQFYKLEHEEEILSDTMDLVAGDFDRYFHKI